MASPNQLSSLSTEEVATLLAETAVLNRRLRAKTAGWLSDLYQQAGNAANNVATHAGNAAQAVSQSSDPTMAATRHGLIGAGLGAVAGGVMSAGQPPQRRRTLQTMLQGALLGGTAGAGLSAYNSGSSAASKAIADRTKPYPGVATRVGDAATSLNKGELSKAVGQVIPNPAGGVGGAVIGGIGGAAAGAAANTVRNHINLPNIVDSASSKALSDVVGGTDAGHIKTQLGAAPRGRLGHKPITPAMQPHLPALRKNLAPAGRAARRGGYLGAALGSAAGMFLGAGRGQGEYEQSQY